MTDLKIHPKADLFPMMAADELAALAEDIKANGLKHPIVLDSDGELIVDGRNRFRACKMAGVEPIFRNLDGEDPDAFIVSANLHRRNLSKGQQAMLLAMIYPEPERGRGKKDGATKAAESADFSYRRLAQARYILHNNPMLAKEVVAGNTTFDEALKRVERERLENRTSGARMAKLRGRYPDLAELVDEERLSLDGAEAEANRRDAALKNQRDSTVRLVDQWFGAAVSFGANDALLNDEVVIEQVVSLLGDKPQFYREQLLEGCEKLQAFIKRIEQPGLPAAGIPQARCA